MMAEPAGLVVRLERDGDIAVVVIDNPPVNAGSAAVRQGLLRAIKEIGGDPGLSAGVLIGAGKHFISGSDIKEFGGKLAQPELPAVIAAITNCSKPIVAALSGAALGGGYELALGCDGRIARADAVVGLPEVTLGIIPGAGGTQRLPRLVGIPTALDLIVSARRVKAPEALALGMVDAICGDDLRGEAVAMARALRGGKRRVGDKDVPAASPEEIDAAIAKARKKGRGRTAVARAIEAVQLVQSMPFDQALLAERRLFEELRAGEEAAALRHLFFAERQAFHAAPGEAQIVRRVGVVGAGTMGTGIAVAFADAGIEIVLVERDGAVLERSLERIADIHARNLAAGRIEPAAAEAARQRLSASTELSALADCDLVVEAVFEDMAAKTPVLTALDGLLKPSAIIASNTSYLDLNQLAALTQRPDRVLGLHFFSPAHVMRLLEIVKGAATSPETLATAFALAKELRKIPVLAGVCEGFIGNRIYSAYRSQCEFLLEEGAYPEQVDAALEEFGFAMGPFAVGDLSGLDIAWRMRQRLAESRDPRARYVDILDRLCEAGRFGRKSGAGWYLYKDGANKGAPDPFTHRLVEDASERKGITRRPLGKEEIVSRALAAILNEAALVLEEGIAQVPSDIDLVLVHGYGFPAHRGGPIFWASRRPRQQIVAALTQLEQATGFGFRRGPVEAMLDRLKAEESASIPPAPESRRADFRG